MDLVDETAQRVVSLFMEQVSLQITLPLRVGRLETRTVRFARIAPDRWRSIEAPFAAQRRAPYAETVYAHALTLPDLDGQPLAPRYARPATPAGGELARRLRERLPESEIVTRRGSDEYRLVGWADDLPIDASALRCDRPLTLAPTRCHRCQRTIDEGAPNPCHDCLVEQSGMPAVIARAIRLRASLAPLLFYDTETDGLPEIDDTLRVIGRLPHVWQLAWRAVDAGEQRAVTVRELAGPPLPLRLARLSGVDPERSTRGEVPARVWSDFMRAAGGRTLIAHNGALFDDPIVRASLAAHGLFPLRELDEATFDTLPLARALWPSGGDAGPARHTLGALADYLGIQAAGDLHDAAVDVAVLGALFSAMVDEAERRFGGAAAARATAQAVDDPSLPLPTLYGWTRSQCPTCGRRSFGNRPADEACRVCRDAARPYRAACGDCGESDALDYPPAPDYRCRICRGARPAA